LGQTMGSLVWGQNMGSLENLESVVRWQKHDAPASVSNRSASATQRQQRTWFVICIDVNTCNMENTAWSIGQRIKVTCERSKHHGRYAMVTRVNHKKLSVVFEDGQPGQFVDKEHATLAPVRTINSGNRMGRRNNNSQDNDNEVSEVTRILEQLAFTAATLISADYQDTERTERALDAFQSSVRNSTRMITNQRRNATLN
jgi:hypothetical protein